MVMTIGKVSKAEDEKLYPETEYYGLNGHDVWKRLYPDGSSERLPLEPSLKLANHSPTGFSWGYGGSGPAQLALALLLDATSDPEAAQAHYQLFKFDKVAGWGEAWRITRSEILLWLEIQKGHQLLARQGKN